MSNMPHCRFRNTWEDLMDTLRHMKDEELSESENRYRLKLISLCDVISGMREDVEALGSVGP